MKKCYDKNDFIYAGSCISFDLFEAIEKCFVPVMKGLLRVHGSFSHRFILLSAKGRRWFAGPLSVPCVRRAAAAKPRCSVNHNIIAGIANSGFARPWARHPALGGAHLPVEEVALAGSARSQVAL